MLAEYLFFCLFVGYVYSADVQYLDFVVPENNSLSNSSSGSNTENSKASLSTFTYDVFSVHDIFYKYDLTVTEDEDITRPLTLKSSIIAL